MADDRPRVILTEHLDDEPAAWLAERTHLLRQSHEDTAALAAALADARGLVVRTYTQVDAALLDAAPKLRVVGRAGVGLDNIDLDACGKRGVRVVYTPDANTQAVVEYVWFVLGDLLRPRAYLNADVTDQRFHELRKTCIGAQLDAKVLGILGLGRIGRRVAQVASAIGMRVIYNDLRSPADLHLPAGQPGDPVDKATLWRESDILTIHVDGRADNRGLIDADVLAQLKPTCLLLNAARGMLIDSAALAAWATGVAERGGAAALDVHDPEPPPTDYPLYGLANVKLLPHLASRTPQAMANMSWVVRDVVAVLNGDEPRYPAG